MTFIDNVRSRASSIQGTTVLLMLVLWVPYVLGWVLGKFSQGAQLSLYALGWLGGKASVAARYSWASVETGWNDARSGPDKGGSR